MQSVMVKREKSQHFITLKAIESFDGMNKSNIIIVKYNDKSTNY